jgi:lipopolysaccharide biosynthesis glycosyltransferase
MQQDLSKTPINILMCSDERGVAMMHMSLKTIFDSNRYENLEVHIITDGFSEASTEKINVLGKHFNREIVVHTISGDDLRRFDIPYLEGKEWPIAATFRLIMGRLLPDLHRVIYLDIDTMTRRSLLPLWLTDLDGCVVGGVRDVPENTQERLGNPSEYPYINSGVMLVDLDRWRALDLDTKLIAAIADHPEQYCYFDQDAINHLLYDKIKLLPAVYNVMMLFHYRYQSGAAEPEELDYLQRCPVVVHFIGQWKPWNKGGYAPGHFKRDLVKRYIAMAPKTESLWKSNCYYEAKGKMTLRYAILRCLSEVKRRLVRHGIYLAPSWHKYHIVDPYPNA